MVSLAKNTHKKAYMFSSPSVPHRFFAADLVPSLIEEVEVGLLFLSRSHGYVQPQKR